MTLTKKKSFNEIMREMLEPRSPEAGPGALDLTAHYNASLLHLSRIEASGKLLTPYPEGLRKIEQTHFDVRGLVHLAGTNLPIPFPQKVENITVNRKCASVVFLHGAISAVADGTRIASYVLRFGDGTTNVVPVIYGKDVKTRWADPQVDPEINTPPAAWVGPLNKSGPTRESLRLYITRWRNPGRAAELRSIDFISHMTPAAPFLAAITIE
jgi:hypothetical protein